MRGTSVLPLTVPFVAVAALEGWAGRRPRQTWVVVPLAKLSGWGDLHRAAAVQVLATSTQGSEAASDMVCRLPLQVPAPLSDTSSEFTNRGGTLVRQAVSIIKAAQLVGVSRRTIYNWLASGRLEYRRTAGGSARIFVDSLWRDPVVFPHHGPAPEWLRPISENFS